MLTGIQTRDKQSELSLPEESYGVSFTTTMSKINALILLASSLALACHDEAATPETKENKTYLVSTTPVQEVNLQTLQAVTAVLGRKELLDLLKYGVKTYRLVYQTTYNGKTINASGLILLPTNMQEAAPIISVQHGTTFVKDDAPSAAGGYTGMELFASAGYIALMPDFIGYGESSTIFHPYYDKEHSARAVIDMIKAAKEYLLQQKIAFNDKLFLAGYSEGGYVTLAAANEIETDPTEGLKVTAVAAGAGGYDLVEMLKGVTTNDYYSYPSYLSFVLMSYNTTYGWNKNLSYFFSQPYADSLGKYMNGQYDGGFINSKLTTSVNKLFNPQFFQRLKTAEGEPELKQAIINNSVAGWKTAIPTRLFHGTRDEIIPYHNSEVTLEKFKASGSGDVTLKLIPGGTHGSAFVPMLEEIVPWFQSLR
jgi:dipeptidyl aminopeptidase/acylaminoacyl peptidase